MRKELAEVVQFLGLDGGEGDEYIGGGGALLELGGGRCFVRGGWGGVGMCFHTEQGLAKRVQRQNKDRVCVVKGGGALGGYFVGRNTREREGRSCVCM